MVSHVGMSIELWRRRLSEGHWILAFLSIITMKMAPTIQILIW